MWLYKWDSEGKNIGFNEGSPKMTLAIIQVAYRMPFATQAGAAQKILMKRGVHHVLQEL